MVTDLDGPMPSPPFPDRDNTVLKMIVNNAISAMRSGEATAEAAILRAAVHGWYEGHIEGEDKWPGCDFPGRPAQGGAPVRGVTRDCAVSRIQ
jgi:hypothetical protein